MDIKTLSIDLETYSSIDLGKCGVYKYTESPDFEILLFGYSVNEGKVRVIDLACGEKIPSEILMALTDDAVTKWAHNSSFERVCLSAYLRKYYPEYFKTYDTDEEAVRKYLDPASWKCSMIWASYLGLPRSLKDVGVVLKLDEKKMEEGKELIRYFCQPCTPTKANGGRTRNMPDDAPEKWELFKKYNGRDVEVEISIAESIAKFPVPDFVWDEYHIDQKINDRGVLIDMELVKQAISIDAKAKEELKNRMQQITELENPNSVQQMREWLADNGLETESLGKKEVKAMAKEAEGEIKEVLTLRQQLAKSSVSKYKAMENAACSDGRARGTFAFYGANRTGRFAGRIIQLQNLPQNHLDDLKGVRELVRRGDYEAVRMLYDDVPDTLSQLIRTAFVPKKGSIFLQADFSAIEARVLSWFAGEAWRTDLFIRGGDIYCQSASEMFHVPVVKNGINGELRQKGKVAELACIAEGSPVLTDRGLIPIEKVCLTDKVWDGENWVTHEGVIYKGEREVIEYEGLTATPDHLVWVEGKPEPIRFGIAAACGAHLVQTGDGGRAIRLGENYQPGKKMEQELESLLCADSVPGMWNGAVATTEQSAKRNFKGMSAVFSAEDDSEMAGQKTDSGKTTLRESKRSRIPQLRRKRNPFRFSKYNGSGSLSYSGIRASGQVYGDRPHRYEQGLCTWKSSVCGSQNELCESTQKRTFRIFTGILAVLPISRHQKVIAGTDKGRDYQGCGNCGMGEAEKLADHQCTARLYDIRNAGPHHRFTVSNCLVHNCGYGGGVGALKAMGALEMGLTEEELQPLVTAWRNANPNIVRFWWSVDKAAMEAVKKKTTVVFNNLTFAYQSGFLFITLPSGRRLAYAKPRIGKNQFDSDAITYEGVGTAKKWERQETYGPKLVENIVQGTSRDILCYAMKNLKDERICMHIHDELVIEGNGSLERICEIMGQTPPWAEGLVLRADGDTMEFYQKA